MSLINVLFYLVLFLYIYADAFTKAPGTLTLRVIIREMIDGCVVDEGAVCQYHLEFCIGSGRTINEQCLWFPSKVYSGQYYENQGNLATQSFEVDDIRSSFYFNANLTFRAGDKLIKELKFRNSLFHYDALNGTHTSSLHSENFVSMIIEIDVKCKLGYFPKFRCTQTCFSVPEISKCDNNGNLICSKGYMFSSLSNECIKNPCMTEANKCQNNATCTYNMNNIGCTCQRNYSGTFCETWDPCIEHKCLNSGFCIKRTNTKDYTCQCKIGYNGKYCENIENPCTEKKCPPESICEKKENVATCVTAIKSEQKLVNIGWFQRDYRRTTFESMIITKRVEERVQDESGIRNRETVKLIQYPVQKDFTTISIIVGLFVLVMCFFGVTFWMQRHIYFQKSKKYSSYPNIPPIPSMSNMPTYRSADENFKRWHSLDDNSFYICHQPHNEQFATMSYKSGTNLWPRYENSQDSYKNWPPTFKSRMPMMNESSNFDSGDTNGNLCESIQNNSEKMEDYMPDCVTVNNTDLPMYGPSYN